MNTTKRQYKAKNLIFAKEMRKEMTREELILWQNIRNKKLGIRFRRQCPIDNFILDFVSFEIKLIIEIDGGQHCQSKYDYYRDLYFVKRGYRVFRFVNNEIHKNLGGVLDSIFYGIRNKNYCYNYNFCGK
ncbi:MAG: very-short-patch-repair endonuclease [Rickettsiales bacterium]|jgi:very-short-patch-repair endonuclease